MPTTDSGLTIALPSATAETSLSPDARIRGALLGLAIAVVALAASALAGLLIVSALFCVSPGGVA